MITILIILIILIIWKSGHLERSEEEQEDEAESEVESEESEEEEYKEEVWIPIGVPDRGPCEGNGHPPRHTRDSPYFRTLSICHPTSVIRHQ
jgi:hypothetical protein